MEPSPFLLYALAGILFSMFTATVAMSKGYDRVNWALGGFLFTFVALVAIVGMPMKSENVAQRAEEARRAEQNRAIEPDSSKS